MKHRTTIAALLAAATLFAAPALAAQTGTDSCLSGQQQSTARHGQFEGLSGLTTDEERAAFFSGNETGGDEGSDLQLPLDTAALVEAGVIDADTAAKIEAYAGEAHDALHDLFAGKSDMAPEARNDWLSAIPRDADPLDGLAQVGVITPEQAQAIRDYLEKLA